MNAGVDFTTEKIYLYLKGSTPLLLYFDEGSFT